MTENDESKSRTEYRLDRTLAISDGVFAFAVTLLVLDLVVPSLSPNATSIDLWQALTKEYISFLSYILSFLIAGVWWNAHHRNFGHIRSSDSTLRWLNLLFLLWIALLPFFTKILDQYINLQLGVVLYAADQAAAGIFLTSIWTYASKNHRLIDKNMKETAIKFTTFRNAMAPIFFFVSMGISFISPSLAPVSWYGMVPVFFAVNRLERKSENK
jgi:TMEM175 potassium channel family protein